MNKLGFYLEISSDQDGLFNAFRTVKPPVVLLHNNNLNQDILQINRRESGLDAFVIGRWFVDNHAQERLLDEGDPAANGRALADTIVRHDFELAKKRGANGRRLIDAWMTLNEVIPGPASSSFAENKAINSRYRAVREQKRGRGEFPCEKSDEKSNDAGLDSVKTGQAKCRQGVKRALLAR